MEDMVRKSFQNVIITCIWCFGRCFQPSCADQRKKIFPLPPSHDESEILYKAKFAYYRSILGFCSFPSSKCEKITPNVTKQNWNSYKFLFSIGSENFFFDLCSCKNVNFKSLFPFSPQHNFGKFSSNIKSKDSFEIRIVLAIRKCQKF